MSNPMHEYFHKGRNDDIHEGFGLVSGLTATAVVGDESIREKWLLREGQGRRLGPPAEECRDYFEALLRISLEGFREFGTNWDPNSVLATSLATLEREELRPTH
jgi:hypothetical protein